MNEKNRDWSRSPSSITAVIGGALVAGITVGLLTRPATEPVNTADVGIEQLVTQPGNATSITIEESLALSEQGPSDKLSDIEFTELSRSYFESHPIYDRGVSRLELMYLAVLQDVTKDLRVVREVLNDYHFDHGIFKLDQRETDFFISLLPEKER